MTKRVNRLSVGVGAGLCAWALVLNAGCDQRSDAAKAVDKGAGELHALSGSSPEPAMDATRQKTFTKVAGDLAPAVSGGTDAEKSTASLLVCQTQLGLGEDATADAAALEREALNRITEADALVSKWRMRSAVAGAAEAYDPSGQRADIAKSRQEKEGAIQREQARKTEVQGQLDDLNAKSKAKMDAAAAKEAEYGRLTQEAVKLTAVQAAPIVEQANKVKREGDALRLDGAKLDAQAQSVAPLVTEIDAIVSQLTNQKKNLEATDASLGQQLAGSKAEAAEARSDATAASVELEKQVTELTRLRGDAVEAAYGKALGLYGKGANAAKEAVKQSPGAGKVALGNAQMCIADAHWQKSQGLKAYALLLDSMATAEPALAKKGDYAALAKGATDQAKKELEDAAGALESAKSAFSTAQVSGDAKKKLQDLSALLDQAIKVSREDSQGVSADLLALTGKGPAVAAAPSGTPAPEGAAAAATDPEVLAAIDSLLGAVREGRLSDVTAMTYIPEASKAAVQPLLDFIGSFARVDAAFKAKFGKGFIESASTNPMIGAQMGQMGQMGQIVGLPSADQAKSLKASDFKAAVTGDSATATANGIAMPLQFKKVDGKWMFAPAIDPAMAGAVTGNPMAMMAGKAFAELGPEVEAGKYADANAAIAALGAKVAAAMGAGGPPGGGKKGGPGGG
jgi:hypothetical protein